MEKKISVILTYFYLLLLVGVTFLNLNLNTNGGTLYTNLTMLSIVVGLICIIFNIKNIKFNQFILVVIFVLINLFSFYFFSKEGNFYFYTMINMGIAMIYFIGIGSYTKNYKFLFYIIILSILLFDIICLFNNPSDALALKGISTNENQLAAMNVAGLLMTVGLFYFKNNNKIINLGYLIVAIFLLFIIYLTGSRTALGVSLIFLFLFVWNIFYNKTNNKKTFLILSLAIFLFIIISLVILFIFKRNDIENIMNDITSGRWGMWTELFPRCIDGHIVLGRGAYSIRNIIDECDLYATVINSNYIQFWHNFIVDALYNGGIVALSLLLSIFGMMIFKCIKYCKYFKNYSFEVIQLLCLLLLFSFDVMFIWSPTLLNVCFFVVAGNLISKLRRLEIKYEK